MQDDEAERIACILGGQAQEFAWLVDRYQHRVFRHCFYILHDENAAEDAAQEAFLRAFQKLHTFDSTKASFKTWLLTIATRHCLDELRKKAPLPLHHSEYVESPLATPQQQAAAAELRDAVLRLPPRYRTVVSLYYWQGYSYEEIAAYMRVPIGSVRGWLHRAKRQLKEVLL